MASSSQLLEVMTSADSFEEVTTIQTWTDVVSEQTTAGGDAAANGRTAGGSRNVCSPHFRYIFFVIIMGSVSTIGLLGNSISVFLLWEDRHKSAIFLLISLTFVDDLVLISFSMITTLPTYVSYTRRYMEFFKIFPVVQTYVYPFCTLILMMTTYLTVIVTSQRYIAVCHPYHSQKYGTLRVAKLQFLGTMLFCIIFNIPRFLEYRIRKTETGRLYRFITDLSNDEMYETIYMVSLYYIFAYILPLCALLYMTVRLIKALHASRKRREEMTSQSSQKEDMTVILVAVVVIFVVCQILNPIRRVWEAVTESEDRVCGKPYFYFSPFVPVGVALNSSVNFIIYVVCGTRFRRRFLRLLRRFQFGGGRVQPLESAVGGTASTTTGPGGHQVGGNQVSTHL